MGSFQFRTSCHLFPFAAAFTMSELLVTKQCDGFSVPDSSFSASESPSHTCPCALSCNPQLHIFHTRWPEQRSQPRCRFRFELKEMLPTACANFSIGRGAFIMLVNSRAKKTQLAMPASPSNFSSQPSGAASIITSQKPSTTDPKIFRAQKRDPHFCSDPPLALICSLPPCFGTNATRNDALRVKAGRSPGLA
jgi:hypothetical protein